MKDNFFVLDRPKNAPENIPYYCGEHEYIYPKKMDKFTNEPVWVQEKRKGILKEQLDNQQLKKYTCCNCGEKIEKKHLANHATICKDPYEKTADAIERMEKRCSEVDYTKLRPGMKVKIKSWNRMVDEYGVNEFGNIDKSGLSICYNASDEKIISKSKRVVEIEKINMDISLFWIISREFALPVQCIESIIEEPEQKQDDRLKFVSAEPIPWVNGNPVKANVVVRDEIDAPIETNPFYNNWLGLPWMNKTEYNQELHDAIYSKIQSYQKEFGHRPKIIIVCPSMVRAGILPFKTFQGIRIIGSPAEKEVSVF